MHEPSSIRTGTDTTAVGTAGQTVATTKYSVGNAVQNQYGDRVAAILVKCDKAYTFYVYGYTASFASTANSGAANGYLLYSSDEDVTSLDGKVFYVPIAGQAYILPVIYQAAGSNATVTLSVLRTFNGAIPSNADAALADVETAVELIDDAVYVDDADWTDSTSKHVLIGGVYQASPQTITSGDVGPLQVDVNGRALVKSQAESAEDTAHANGDKGVVILAARNDNTAQSYNDDGTYGPLRTNSVGHLLTCSASGAETYYTEDEALDEDPTGATIIMKREDTLSASTVSGDGDAISLRGTAKGQAHVYCDGTVAAIASGATLTLKASGAQTESTNGTGVSCGQYHRFAVLLDVTAQATDGTDTLDVFVDVSPDGGTTWINAIHFDQVMGNGSPRKIWATLDAANPGTSTIEVTSDASAGAVRPALFGNQIRYRSAIVDDGTDNASFTYAVTAFAQ